MTYWLKKYQITNRIYYSQKDKQVACDFTCSIFWVCVCAIVACVFETGTALYTAWDVFYQWDGQTCRLMTRFVPSCSSWKSEIHSERHIWEFKLLELSMLMFSSLRDTKTTKNCLFLLLAIRLLWTWGSLKS